MISWLPLETVPGLPQAPEVSTAWMIMLMFVLPLAAGALITLLTLGPSLIRRFRNQSEQPGTQLVPK